ncbi:ATP-binding protein [Sphaerisporangium corydalis]|uniref:ATP-binding protein n=1 Tax=Sphaerisporangium corydalis TaxID=1441875 RepID=A0ABV9EAC2_9ACTN|nr:ATP-binding protein [Sphaerisporangium corydalis]
MQNSSAPSAGLVWSRAFPGRLDQAAHARRFVRFLLEDTPCADDAELIVSELAGNALRHTRSGTEGGSFLVEVTLARPPGTPGVRERGGYVGVLISVHDDGGGGVPRLLDHGTPPGAENGRGLAIVTALATRVGFQGAPTLGHTVWVYVRTTSA